MTDTLPLVYEQCDQCRAPLDDAQRYCVVCGASRHHPGDPVARYLAAARRRPAAPAPLVAVAPGRDDRRWIALALACLPLAAAFGVLVGRTSGDGNDQVLAALRAQKAPIVQVGGAGAAAATSATADGTITSDFTLARGFVVRLSTLPQSASPANVHAAEAAARKAGAKAVGVLVASDFTVQPATKDGYVVYAGQYHARAAAQKALGRLRKAFPKAVVVAVRPAAGAVPKGEAAKEAAALNHVVVRKHPSQQQKQEGAQVVQQIQSRKGKSYVEQQQQLPDTVVVP